MSNEKSIVPDKLDYAAKAEQKSTDPKRAFDSHRIDRPMLQNVRLIWLDNDIDNNSADCHNTIAQLRHIVNTIDIFTDCDECVDFLTDIYNDNVCIIVSGALCQNVVPLIHAVSQLRTIFIYYRNKTQHEHWTADCSKVKGVFTDVLPICGSLKQTVQKCERNAISMNFMDTSDDISKKKLDQLEPSFMYTQLLRDILLQIEFGPKHFTEFIDSCREESADNQTQLNNIAEFQIKYPEKTPIWWYTRESFLYTALNRALRLMEVNLILKLGFFISDLHRQIEQLHKGQFADHNSNNIFKVYRGQGLTKEDFEKMRKTKGGLIAFNNFLSTSQNYNISQFFAESNQQNPDLIAILFMITVDPSKSTAPFASINHISQFEEEDEFLFSMHTVFRIDEIKPIGENQCLFQVELTLTTDNDKDLLALTECIREETERSTQWDALGQLLYKLGQMDRAQQIYQLLLNDEFDEDKKSHLYFMLGSINDSQGAFNDAITFHEKSAEIRQRSLPSNHPHLADSYNSIAVVCDNIGEYSKALSYYEKSLAIQQQSLPSNHRALAGSYNNISLVYLNMGEYSKAISYHEKSLAIQQQSLPSNHPHLAASYNNIGSVSYKMGEYSKALSYYEKSLAIRQQSLPSNHPDLAASYNNIGLVYDNMGEYSKAISYYEKSLAIRQQSLPSNHPDLAVSYHNIGLVYDNMGEYSKALSYYENSLAIKQQSLPSNHPDLAASYNNIGLVYDSMGEYSKAISYYEKSLAIRQQSLPSNHPRLAGSYNNIGVVYYNMGEYSKALSYYEKALGIRQQSLPSNHPDLAASYNNIGLVYDNMGEYSKALSYYEKSLAIQQQSLPSNHPDLARSYVAHSVVYNYMGEHSKSITFYQKAFEILQQLVGENYSDLNISCCHVGNLYTNMGGHLKALLFWQLAIAIAEYSLPANHPHLEWCRKKLENVIKQL
jgi:tetratricopeptide (TPR) repeat protein